MLKSNLVRNPKKKSDIYDSNDKCLSSMGAIGYADYPTYLAKVMNHLPIKVENYIKHVIPKTDQ